VLFATFGKQDAVGVPSPVAGISLNSARHRFMQRVSQCGSKVPFFPIWNDRGNLLPPSSQLGFVDFISFAMKEQKYAPGEEAMGQTGSASLVSRGSSNAAAIREKPPLR